MKSKHAGFTMVELVVAVGLIGLIAAILLGLVFVRSEPVERKKSRILPSPPEQDVMPKPE